MTTVLHGKTALITGASSGIGKCIAEKLAVFGMHLVLLGRSEKKLLEVTRAIEKKGSRTSAYVCDFSDTDKLIQTLQTIVKNHTAMHAVIHSAGLLTRQSIQTSTPDKIHSVFSVNYTAPAIITGSLLSSITKPGGHVIFINSSIVKHVKPYYATYRASKVALKSLADTLREETRSDGIIVTSIYPPSTATPMQKMVKQLEQQSYIPEDLLDPEIIADTVAGILLRTQTFPDDIHISPRSENSV